MKVCKFRNKLVRALTLISGGAAYLCSISSAFAAVDVGSNQGVKTVSYEHVLNWSLGLIIVLCIFFICIWFMRKMGALPTYSKEQMRVISGLSLGMREKLVLVQIGNTQMVLGITQGRIVNLLTLKGDEQLFQEQQEKQEEGEFSQKLKQLMKNSDNE